MKEAAGNPRPYRSSRRTTALSLLLCLLLSPIAARAKEIQWVSGEGIRVDPQRVMHIAWNGDGTVTPLSDWVEMSPPSGGETGTASSSLNVFDAFYNDGNACGTGGAPNCPEGCCDRYAFEGYCNTFTVAEMDSERDGTADRVQFAWYWTCDGSGTERCIVAVITGESPDFGCAGYALADGIIYDFGELPCNGGGYYFADVCLCDAGMWQQVYKDGASAGILAKDFQGGELVFATCAQFILYGGYAEGLFDLAGSHGPNQFNDDNPRDGRHDFPGECYNYAFGRCPDPLRWSMGMGDCGNVDCPSDACNGGEALKVKTRAKGCGCQLKAVLTNATPGLSYGFVMPDLECKTAVANSRGKAVAKDCPSRGGDVTVPTCGLRRTATCP